MRRIIGTVILTNLLLSLGLLGFFTLYGQFLLDYSLENLRLALEDNRFGRPVLESLALEEISRRDGDLQMAILLDDAVHSLGLSLDEPATERARIFIHEVLRQKTQKRAPLLRAADAVYHMGKFLHAQFKQTVQPPGPDVSSGVSLLLVNEAERLERKGRLEEAERYYREFINRYPEHSKRGFVRLALAHVVLKAGRMEEAVILLQSIQEIYQGQREALQAQSLLMRAESAKKRLSGLIQIENRLRNQPQLLFTEEGGLELALAYLATYQLNRALSVLGKISEAPDLRLRTKARFYRDWIRQWQEHPDQEILPF